MSNEQRVVVTGMGAVSPLGRGVTALWDGLLAGRSGVRALQGLDLTGQEVDFGGQAYAVTALPLTGTRGRVLHWGSGGWQGAFNQP